MVYDVTSRESFQKIEDWLNELETYATNHDIKKILVGNKCDKARTGGYKFPKIYTFCSPNTIIYGNPPDLLNNISKIHMGAGM